MPLTKEAQDVVDAFGHQPGVTNDQLNNLKKAINGSPALTQEVNDAVKQGHLQHIVPLNNPHAGGEYNADAHEMRLPLSQLNNPAHGKFDTGEMTFVLGHELQHGFNAATVANAYTTFDTELNNVAKSPGRDHDYTPPIDHLVSANRRDEAGAEISGWNAIVSAAQKDAADHHKAAPTLKDIYNRQPFRMDDFIDVDRSHTPPTYSMKPNLEVDAKMHMDATPKNLEGMGKNYFDHPNSGLGHNGNSSYANYYGAYAIGRAVDVERSNNPPQPGVAPAHDMSINMAQLHFSPRIVAENGLNLGANTSPMPYLDTSTHPPTHANFRQSDSTHTYTPVRPGLEASAPAAPNLDQAGHPDHALYQQARGAVHRLDMQQGHAPDQRSDNLAAALVVAARRDGLNEVNHAVLSTDAKRTFAVQGDPQSPFRQTAQVDTVQAVNTSVHQSSQAWQQVAQQRSPDQAQAQGQNQQPAPQQAANPGVQR